MKIECLRDKLKEAVGVLDRVTAKNLSLPVLSAVYFETNKNGLTARATNLDIGVEVLIPAKIHSNGSFVIPGAVLHQTLINIPFENITLEEENGNLTIKTPRTMSFIKGYIKDEFPSLPIIDNQKSFINIHSKQLLNGMRSVIYSSAISDIKPEIASIYIYTKDNDILFVSTDGFRLAEKKINNPVDGEIKAIIPYKNVLEIIKILELYDDDCSLVFSNNLLLLNIGNYHITSRLIEGVFPDYPQLIPLKLLTTCSVLKNDLLSIIKLTQIYCDRSNQVLLKTSPQEKSFELISNNPDTGENKARIEGEFLGQETEIFFNIRYMADVFQSIQRPKIIIGLNGKNKPITIKGDGDESFTYLIMPINR